MPEAPRSCVGEHVLAALAKRAAATPQGCFLEVGVYQGGSAWHLAKVAREQLRVLYLYDTFTGIPHKREGVDSHEVGDFADTDIEAVRRAIPSAVVVKGIFPSSALPMPPVAFAHLDCDQWQSYLEALDFLAPRMVRGGVIWCDDVGCLDGANRAVDEFCRARRLELKTADEKPYIQFGEAP